MFEPPEPEALVEIAEHRYLASGDMVVHVQTSRPGYLAFASVIDIAEYGDATLIEHARTAIRTAPDAPVISFNIPGHPRTLERAAARQKDLDGDEFDAMVAKLEAAARWQCEPCDRLFKSPEEFMAHECAPKMYVEICPKYKHGFFRYKPGESARCPGCFPDHASLAQIERMEAKPAVPGDDAREFGTPADIFKGINLADVLRESRAAFYGFVLPPPALSDFQVKLEETIAEAMRQKHELELLTGMKHELAPHPTQEHTLILKPAGLLMEFVPPAPDLEPPSAFFTGLSEGSDHDREVITCGTCKMRGQRQTLRRSVGSCPECNPRPIAVSDQATAAVRRWRDAGGDDDE